MPKPLKAATTVAQQIALLRSRGLDVDEGLACQWLANVSYYRLSAYCYPAREFNAAGQRIDSFIPSTSFTDVVALYEADRKLTPMAVIPSGYLQKSSIFLIFPERLQGSPLTISA